MSLKDNEITGYPDGYRLFRYADVKEAVLKLLEIGKSNGGLVHNYEIKEVLGDFEND